MLAYKLFGSGLSNLTMAAMQDVATGLTATGSTGSDAYQVTSGKNSFTTVASGTGAILDSQAATGDSQVLYNGGASVLRIYPTSGATINGATVAYLQTKTACEFHMLSSTLWAANLSL